jgi:hypothetical protein
MQEEIYRMQSLGAIPKTAVNLRDDARDFEKTWFYILNSVKAFGGEIQHVLTIDRWTTISQSKGIFVHQVLWIRFVETIRVFSRVLDELANGAERSLWQVRHYQNSTRIIDPFS